MSEEKIKQAKKSRKKLKTKEVEDQLYRCLAELENFRKRTEAEKAKLLNHAGQELVIKLLPVLDNFKRASSHAPASTDKKISSWAVGIKAIERQFEDTLKQSGLFPIECKNGDAFNPELHEAVSYEKSKLKEGSIVRVVEDGYRFKGRIIRPCKVIVSAGS